jgi:hypothetical protein
MKPERRLVEGVKRGKKRRGKGEVVFIKKRHGDMTGDKYSVDEHLRS